MNNLNNIYPFKPLPLPFKYAGLEPYIHRDCVRIHYEKFYLSYVENLNRLLSGRKALQFLTLKELITRSFKLPSDYVADLKRSATAVYCHEVYFGFKSAAAELNSIVETSVKSTALTIANPSSAVKPIVSPSSDIIAKFKSMANSVHGSGFVWLVKEKSSEKLSVIATRNTETPNLNLLTPILCIDMWEHAYFLQYKYMRSDYINYFTKMALN